MWSLWHFYLIDLLKRKFMCSLCMWTRQNNETFYWPRPWPYPRGQTLTPGSAMSLKYGLHIQASNVGSDLTISVECSGPGFPSMFPLRLPIFFMSAILCLRNRRELPGVGLLCNAFSYSSFQSHGIIWNGEMSKCLRGRLPLVRRVLVNCSYF